MALTSSTVPDRDFAYLGVTGDRRLALRLFAAALGALGATIGCYVLAANTTVGQRLDRAADLGASRSRFAHAGPVYSQLGWITTHTLIAVLVGFVCIGIIRRRPLLGVACAVAAGGAVKVTDSLKNRHVFIDLFSHGRSVGEGSFPSGHTAAAVACALALVMLFPPRLRGIAAITAGLYASVTAANVQVVGWHQPSDAIGAAFLSFTAITGAAGALAWVRPVSRSPLKGGWLAIAALAVVAVAAAGTLAGTGASVLHSLGPGNPSQQASHDAYIAGLSGTVMIISLLLIGLLLLLGTSDLDGRRSTEAVVAETP
jgi:membrane-associated phospholipid phosphatase